MKFSIKKFDELSPYELYDLLGLRSEVFVVEQDCVYQDIDDKDLRAYHVLGLLGERIAAYARIFNSGDYFSKPSIGRILVKKEERKNKYGYLLVKESIRFIEKNFVEKTIHLSAQKYLVRFYNSLGFTQKGSEYLEDGIPHVYMVKR